MNNKKYLEKNSDKNLNKNLEKYSDTELNRKSILRMSNMESKQMTRDCIRTALLYLMKDTSFEKITVTSIIKRSGVSRAGFYRNYSSKEEVLEEISNTLYDSLSKFIKDEKYKDNAYLWYLDLFNLIKNNSEIFSLLNHANVPHDYMFDANSYMSQLFPHGTAREHYRALAISSATKEIVVDWFQHGMKQSPEEMAEIMSEML